MKQSMVLAVVVIIAFSVVGMTSAAEPEIENKQSNTKISSAHKVLERHGLQQAILTDLPSLGGYQGINMRDGRLRSGSAVYNSITRTIGTVTGNISIILESGSVDDIASSLNLKVTYYDQSSQLALLRADEQEDMLAVLDSIRALPQVKFAVIDILDSRNQPQ
ncbi:hypothetical protein [Vibrio metschnikovii]|uniref:hypothetical protein n=1 Tax=Vibrio metschnikovii TaxID=28172 RepID=UPI00164C1514|nr:hypothetical protein [Vibrio metschnikovii]MBC5830890.1 hypothetical protein [Vibrio metschnikovii]